MGGGPPTFDLPPWRSLIHYQPPVMSTITAASPAKQLVKADSARVLMIVVPWGSNAAIGTDPRVDLVGQFGLNIGTGIQPFVMDYASFGPLVTLEWFVQCGGNVTVLTYSLASLPDDYVKAIGKMPITGDNNDTTARKLLRGINGHSGYRYRWPKSKEA